MKIDIFVVFIKALHVLYIEKKVNTNPYISVKMKNSIMLPYLLCEVANKFSFLFSINIKGINNQTCWVESVLGQF